MLYWNAQRLLGDGLGVLSRTILGVTTFVFGMVAVLADLDIDNVLFPYAFAAFCFTITLACLTKGKLRTGFGRIIGIVVFGLSAWCFIDQMADGVFYSRSKPSVLSAVAFFIAFGWPGICFAIKGKFSFRKDHEPSEVVEEESSVTEKNG